MQTPAERHAARTCRAPTPACVTRATSSVPRRKPAEVPIPSCRGHHTHTHTHMHHTCEHVHSVHASARATHHTCAHHTHMCINVLLDATGHLLQPATDTEKRFSEEMLLCSCGRLGLLSSLSSTCCIWGQAYEILLLLSPSHVLGEHRETFSLINFLPGALWLLTP